MRYIMVSILSILVFGMNGQELKNSNFEKSCDTNHPLPCDWELSWGSKEINTLQKENGNGYLALQNDKSGVSFVEQAINIEETQEIKILRLSGKIRTKAVKGKGASLHMQLYNANGDYITKKDMAGSRSATWVIGNTEWTHYSIQMTCPSGIAQIKFGAILTGEGKADFDDFEVSLTDVTKKEPSALAKDFIHEVAEIIREHSLYRDSIAIGELSKKAGWIIGQAKSTEECQIGIEYLLASLQEYGDHHSFYMTTDEANAWKSNNEEDNPQIEYAQSKRIGNIGYISMPGMHSINDTLILQYGDSLQNCIRELYDDQLTGWIIDLRPNDGGNTQPMVLGLGPILDSGPLGSLVDINGNAQSWHYDDGSCFWEEERGVKLENAMLVDRKLPIAVLTNSSTGSSGEMATISFIGSPYARSFGQPTWGLTTGNGDFELSDGSILFLSSTRMADRNGNIFMSTIKPDVIVEESEDTEEDAVLEAALSWLHSKK